MSGSPALTHFLVISKGPGYWGRGPTVEEAVKAAQWFKPNTEVVVYRCDPTTHVDGLGHIHGQLPPKLYATGRVKADRKSLKQLKIAEAPAE